MQRKASLFLPGWKLAGYNNYLNFCETKWMWLDEQEKVTGVTVMHSDAELDNIYYYFFCFYDTTGAYLTEARQSRGQQKTAE